MRVRVTLIPFLIALFGLAVWSNALYGPFVFDDWVYAAGNPFVKDLSNLLDTSGPRYVAYVSFALNHHLGGGDPFGFHLFNVIVHLINAMLVFSLVAGIFKTPFMEESLKGEPDAGSVRVSVSLVSSVIFLVHPIETQAVTYISQRFTSLATLFYLLSVLSYLKFRTLSLSGSHGRGPAALYALSLLSTLLAMKTKEISFTIPFVILILDVSLFRGVVGAGEGVKARLKRLSPFILSLLIVPVSLMVLAEGGGGGGGGGNDAYNEIEGVMASRKLGEATGIPRWGYLITQATVIMRYLRLLAWPTGQQFDYFWPLSQSVLEPHILLSLSILLSLLLISACLFWLSLKKKDALLYMASFGVIWFFITLSVESSFIPIHDAINEHRVYLPSAGIITAFTSAMFFLRRYAGERRWVDLKASVLAALMLLFLAPPLSIATFLRNEVWRDELRLYEDEAGKNSHEASPHNYLGIAYAGAGRIEDAAGEFRLAVALKPDHFPAHDNLAHAYLKLGLVDEAIAEFDTLKRLKPASVYPRVNLAVLYLMKGKDGEAGEEIKKALEINPENKDAQKVLAYMKSNKKGRIIFR